jgi:hypothetical protein
LKSLTAVSISSLVLSKKHLKLTSR